MAETRRRGQASHKMNPLFHLTTENDLQAMRQKARMAGWSFQMFVAHVLGILIVIEKRERLREAMTPELAGLQNRESAGISRQDVRKPRKRAHRSK